MPDDKKAELIHKLSYDAAVPGFGTWVPGTGKQKGYMNFMPPGGDPVKLSDKEAGQLYALTNLMQVDPGRARTEMDKTSDNVRTVAQTVFNAGAKGAEVNNIAATGAGTVENSRITANAAATSAQSISDMRNAQIGDLEDQRNRRGELVAIQAKVDALDPSDTLYPQKLRQLQALANLANVKNGAPLNFGRDSTAGGASRKSVLQTPAEQKVNPDGSYTAFAKDGGMPLYNTWHGETLPLGMEVDQFTKLKGDAAKARVQMQLGENDGKLEYRFIGADGNPYATVEQAGRAKPSTKTTGSPTPTPPAQAQGVDVRAIQRGLVMYPTANPNPVPRQTRPMGYAADLIDLARTMSPDSSRLTPEQLRDIGAPQMLGLPNR
jgi:hypothetical protein